MAISSDQLRQQFLAQILNQAPARSSAEGISSLGTSLAAVIASRTQVPAAQKREADLKAKEQADRIGGEVGLRDALVGLGIDPGRAGGIASAPEGSRGALLGLLPKPETALQTEQRGAAREKRVAGRKKAAREERQFEAGQGLAKRVLQGEFGEISQEQRLDAMSAAITGDAAQLSGILEQSGREFEVIGNKDQGLHRFDPKTGKATEIIPPVSGGLDKGKQAELTQKIRKETAAIPAVKSYRKALPAVKSALKSANIDTKAADLDIIFAVMKAVDPESVVRESEQAVAFKAGSPAERFFGVFNEVAGGGRLTLQQRQELLQVAMGRTTAFRESAVSDLAQFQAVSDAADLDQAISITQLEPLPVVGAVVGGGQAQGALPSQPGASASQVIRFDAQGNVIQ